MTHGLAAVAATFVVLLGAAVSTTAHAGERHRPGSRTIRATLIVGDCDTTIWARVLELLPTSPARIEILDVDRLSADARGRVKDLQAFVLSGQDAIFVVRQGAALRMAELGDAVDRLVLASVLWHEMGHLEGLDEAAAIVREQNLWRTFIAAGRVDSALGLTYVARLEEGRRGAATVRAGTPASDASSAASRGHRAGPSRRGDGGCP